MPISTEPAWGSRRDAVRSLVFMAFMTAATLQSLHHDRYYPAFMFVMGVLVGLGLAVASVRLDFFYAAPRIVYPAVALIIGVEYGTGNTVRAVGAVGALLGVAVYDYLDNQFPADASSDDPADDSSCADTDVDD